MNFRKVSALASVAVLAFAACSNTGGGTPSPAASTGGGGSSPAASSGAGASAGASSGALTPSTPAPAGDSSKGTVTIAIELPQQGSEKAASDPIINGIKLAVKLAGGAAGGYKIDIPQSAIYDDALNGAHDPQTGANNMSKVVADEATVAVIGPLNSSVAAAQIPISNEAGLLQCSPANTNPDLTKGQPRQGPAHEAEQLHPRRHD